MGTRKGLAPVERSEALDETIIDLLSEGRFVEDACADVGITRQRLQVWRRDDPDFDARVWSAIGAGIWFQRERILKLMHETAETAGPSSNARLWGYKAMLDDLGRMAVKLLKPLNDKLRVEGEISHNHLVITWMDGPSDIETAIQRPPAGRQPIDHQPAAPINGAAASAIA